MCELPLVGRRNISTDHINTCIYIQYIHTPYFSNISSIDEIRREHNGAGQGDSPGVCAADHPTHIFHKPKQHVNMLVLSPSLLRDIHCTCVNKMIENVRTVHKYQHYIHTYIHTNILIYVNKYTTIGYTSEFGR